MLLKVVGWGVLAGVWVWSRLGHGLTFGEVLQRAAGLVRGNDSGQIKLWDPCGRGADHIAQVRPVPHGHRGEGVLRVKTSLVGQALAEELELVVWDTYLFRGRVELLRHSRVGGVQKCVRRGLHSRKGTHLILWKHRRDVARPDSIWASPSTAPHHCRVHPGHAHWAGGVQHGSRWIMGQLWLAVKNHPHGTVCAAVGAHRILRSEEHLGGRIVPHVSCHVGSRHHGPIWHHLIIRGGDGLNRIMVQGSRAGHGILGHLGHDK